MTTVEIPLNSHVVAMAESLNIDLSHLANELLLEEVKRRWQEENKAAINAYNERVARDGLPLAKYRTF